MNLLVQLISMIGMVLILLAFIGLQRAWWTSTQRSYLWYNLLGSILLTVVALWDRRIGFIILEGVWAIVSAVALARPRKLS